MASLVLRALLFFGIGLVLGIGLARSVDEGERHHRETGERARPVLVHAFRLLLLCIGFGVLWKMGPMALGTSLIGFLLARPLWLRFARRR